MKKVIWLSRVLKTYAVLTAFGMLLVVLMGAIVTKTGSQDGCGTSWPLCYGEVIPDVSKQETAIEFSHRVVSGLLGIMVIVLAILALKRMPDRKETKPLAFLAVFFIVLQGLLGGAAVIWQQSSFVLALHFGFSLIAFASVLLLALLTFEHDHDIVTVRPRLSPLFKIQIYAVTVYTYLVVYTGALVRHTGSSLGCRDWPLCNGQWIPPLWTPAGIQFIHRVAAALIFIWIAILFVLAYKKYASEKAVVVTLFFALLFVFLQALSGALSIWTRLAIPVTLMHSLFVTLLFGALCYLWMLAARAIEKRA